MKEQETLWNPCRTVNQYIINDPRLANVQTEILVTYITMQKHRYVKQVRCYHGRIKKQLCGDIIAWAELPKPYNG